MWPALASLTAADMQFPGTADERDKKEGAFNGHWMALQRAFVSTSKAHGYARVLKPIKEFIAFHSGESYVCLTKLPGSLDKVKDELQKAINDPKLEADIKAFADGMRTRVTESFRNEMPMDLAYAAQMLDPSTVQQIDPPRSKKLEMLASTNPDLVANRVKLATLQARYREGMVVLCAYAKDLHMKLIAEGGLAEEDKFDEVELDEPDADEALLAGPAAASQDAGVRAKRARAGEEAIAAGGVDGATYYDFRTSFELVVLPKLNEAAAMGISFSSFWASQHTGHAFPPSNNRK